MVTSVVGTNKVYGKGFTTLVKRVRVAAGREPIPSAGILDSQSVKCIITDPTRRQLFLVGGASFVTPRYFVMGMKGVLCSPVLSPHKALAFATTKPGLGSNFRFRFAKPQADLQQTAREFAGPLRPAAVEDFAYTFNNRENVPYTGFSTGGCVGDAMGAGWQLWHFTIMAPTAEFDAALPTLDAVMGSLRDQWQDGRYRPAGEPIARTLSL